MKEIEGSLRRQARFRSGEGGITEEQGRMLRNHAEMLSAQDGKPLNQRGRLWEQDGALQERDELLQEHNKVLAGHEEILQDHDVILQEHDQRLSVLESSTVLESKRLDNLCGSSANSARISKKC